MNGFWAHAWKYAKENGLDESQSAAFVVTACYGLAGGLLSLPIRITGELDQSLLWEAIASVEDGLPDWVGN